VAVDRYVRQRMPTYKPTQASLISWSLLVICLIAGIGTAPKALAQGCVAARGSGIPTAVDDDGANYPWEASVSYRWFQSDRHYVGVQEQVQRQQQGTQVINRMNLTDFTISHALSPRYSVDLTIPFADNDRSSTVKDSNNVILYRYHVQASGVGDIRLEGNALVFDPATSHAGNIQLGLGLVLPTGKDNVTDVFPTYNKSLKQVLAVVKTVDESIQPGTGGYGIALSAFGYRNLGSGFTGFASANYVATPQNTNGVNTFRGGYEAIASIADSYLGRIGAEYKTPAEGISLSLGMRIEGVPVHDLVGGSEGFRRPGYSVDIEPGIIINRGRWSSRLYVPYALQRDRQQSVPDKEETAATGVYTQGDAAFADYEVIFSFAYKF
jgi:hypothetical protein